MKVDVIISADDIREEKIKNKVVVVIDVLRATSVMLTALNNGCKGIIPVKEIEEAVSIAKNDRSSFILGGERKGLKIDGFDFSNSPLEYVKDIVKDKTVVMTTSNGTKAIKNSESAKRIFIGALINGRSVAKKIIELNEDVVFVNAGTNGEFSMDDFITSGYMISCMKEEINKNNSKNKLEFTDIAKTSAYIYNSNPDIIGFVKEALHYNRMIELKYYKDLEYCLSKDRTTIVPEYNNGIISVLNKDICNQF